MWPPVHPSHAGIVSQVTWTIWILVGTIPHQPYLLNGWSSQVLSTYLDGQCGKLVTVWVTRLSHWPSSSVYNTVAPRHCIARVCQQQWRHVQGRIHGAKGAIVPYMAAGQKNRDAMPIKSRLYQSQNAPKLAFLSSKIEKCLGEGAQPSPKVGRGTPSPDRTPLVPSAPRSARLRRSTRLATSAHDLGAYGTSDPGASIRPLATPSGSAPGLVPPLDLLRYSQVNDVDRRRLLEPLWPYYS